MSIAFLSSGNQEQDEALAEDFRRSQARLDDNVCPNGCGLMVFDSDHERHCPACNFSQWSNAKLR